MNVIFPSSAFFPSVDGVLSFGEQFLSLSKWKFSGRKASAMSRLRKAVSRPALELTDEIDAPSSAARVPSRGKAGIHHNLVGIDPGSLFDLIHGGGKESLIGRRLGDGNGGIAFCLASVEICPLYLGAYPAVQLAHDAALRIGGAHLVLSASLLGFDLIKLAEGMGESFLSVP